MYGRPELINSVHFLHGPGLIARSLENVRGVDEEAKGNKCIGLAVGPCVLAWAASNDVTPPALASCTMCSPAFLTGRGKAGAAGDAHVQIRVGIPS